MKSSSLDSQVMVTRSVSESNRRDRQTSPGTKESYVWLLYGMTNMNVVSSFTLLVLQVSG